MDYSLSVMVGVISGIVGFLFMGAQLYNLKKGETLHFSLGSLAIVLGWILLTLEVLR